MARLYSGGRLLTGGHVFFYQLAGTMPIAPVMRRFRFGFSRIGSGEKTVFTSLYPQISGKAQAEPA